jgi:hypothetical protein
LPLPSGSSEGMRYPPAGIDSCRAGYHPSNLSPGARCDWGRGDHG